MSTIHLFNQDPYRREFQARVMRRLEVAGQPAVVLDRTCFYPTAGGQPADRGDIQGVPVLDVYEEHGEIVHVLAGMVAAQRVAGRIDWRRRFDHMQQHTGQHVLSQAFVRALAAQTISFHLGDEVSTIDVELPALAPDEAARVEEIANAIVFENRPVRVLSAKEEGIAELGLRKRPTKEGELRVIEVADFDRSACGGTHVRATGELGLIKIRKWERRARGIRVEFVVGWRALRDYQWKNRLVNEVSGELSVKDADLAAALQRLIAEGRETRRELERLREKFLDYEALELLARAAMVGPWHVVHEVFQDRDIAQVRWLAQRLASHTSTIALLGLATEKGHLIFARAPDVEIDMGELLRRVCQAVGGRGGGRPYLAQGGMSDASRAAEALGLARAEIERQAEAQRG